MAQQDHNDKTGTHVVLTEGTMVGHYRIVRKIGAGGMGEVFLADDSKLDRQVAIKFVPAHLMADEKLKARFAREARAAARLNHPNIVTIHEVGEMQGRPYFVMEMIEGQSLHHFAHDEQLPVKDVIRLITQVCEGLAEAHGHGIIHRDIKASNVVVDSKGRAKLLDFGLAAVTNDDRLTRTGATMGTVAYMSPEQVEGKPADERSDLFSLGIVLYELLAGRTPFRRENEAATLKAIIADDPEPVARFRSGVSPELENIVAKLLRKDPSFRYQTASGVLADLKALAAPSGSVLTTTTAVKKKRWPLVGAVAAVLVLAVSGFVYVRSNSHTEKQDSVPMLVVLPFENLGSPDNQYFADGMTDEITSRLAGVKGLGIISRTSAVAYKNSGKTLKEIGKDLGVDYVLEGTVRWSKAGDLPTVRITPQLIRVSDDRHVWADNYEEKLTEVFKVQADIAMHIVSQLGVTLVQRESDNVNAMPTQNVQAYDFYLKGLDYLQRSANPAEDEHQFDSCLAMFTRATELDPQFALAWARKSLVLTRGYFSGIPNWQAYGASSLEAVKKAFEMEPDLPEAHLAMGYYYNFVKTDYDRALEEFNRAKPNMENNSDLLMAIAIVQMRQGRLDDAIINYRKAAELDPISGEKYYWMSICQAMMRDYTGADWSINRVISLDPSDADAYALALSYSGVWYGDRDEMLTTLEKAARHIDPLKVLSSSSGGTAYLGLWRFNLLDTPYQQILKQLPEVFSDPRKFPLEMNLGQICLLGGDTATARTHYLSAKEDLHKQIKAAPDEFGFHGALALTLAYLGDYDAAVNEGKTASELMSIETCHW